MVSKGSDAGATSASLSKQETGNDGSVSMKRAAEKGSSSSISVLHRTWKLLVGLAWSFFIIFEIAIGCDRYYSGKPMCPYSPDKFGAWLQQLNCFCFGGFVFIWLLLAFRAGQGRNDGEKARVPLVVALHIVSMGTIATGLATFANWGGLCIDVLNVASPAALWGEWLACGPLLIYITITIVDKPALSRLDLGLMATFFLCLLTGFFIIPSQPLGSGQFWLFVSCALFIPVLYLPWHKPAPPAMNLHGDSERMQILSVRYAQQFNLSCCLAFLLSLYLANYLVATWGGYGPDVTIAVYQVLSVLSRGLYAGLAMDAHPDLLRSTELELLDERRSNAARRVFMKYIFHEVRTPLSSLAMGVSMLKDNKLIQETESEPLLMMETACEFMSETLDGVLNMQKIEEGKLVLEVGSFSLRDMTDKCAFMFKSSVLQKRLAIKTNISPLIPQLLVGDVHRVLHILSNLISNAIKFSPPDGIITIEANVHGGDGSGGSMQENSTSSCCSVKFSVTDQGPGISAKHQNLLFHNFVQIQAGSLQQGKGSGLGLSLVKQLVQLHSGQVGVVSKEGKGSTFFFIIPFGIGIVEHEPAELSTAVAAATPAAVMVELCEAAPAPAPASASASDSGKAAAAALANELPEILVVDDSSINSKMLTMVLKRKGVRSCIAENGQEAVDLVLADPERFRILLMDNLMPVMDGLEATRRLRASGFSSLICGLTGNVMEDDVIEYQLAGVDMVLPKPLRVEMLDALLAHTQQHGCHSRHAENLALELSTEAPGSWVPKSKCTS